MIDLREWKDLIRNTVAELDEKDINWKWSVKYLGKTMVRIRWGYLDYLEEKQNTFIVSAEDGEFIVARKPNGKIIDCFTVATEANARMAVLPIPIGIKDAIQAVASYAHSRY